MRMFRDEEGLTSVGMAVALLVTLSLVFSAAQVYRVSSACADIQEVADVSALAAENEVAEFMIAVRLSDAVVLSLSLATGACYGLGVVALCTPVTAEFSEPLLNAGARFMEARNSFSDKAVKSLNALQRALPFLAAAQAAGVAAANDSDARSASYRGVALLVPFSADDIASSQADDSSLRESIDEEKDDLGEDARKAEEAAQEANAIKQRAYERDCGANPGYCQYERAASLAGLAGGSNPYYASVDTWSFSVALDRARAYYRARLAQETPASNSIEETVRSEMRRRFYEYAVSELGRGYVYETSDSFSAYFPRLPRNTDEMRRTSLYTDALFPLSSTADGKTLIHAWSGCPGAAGITGYGSISQLESGQCESCPVCGFTAATMGNVASASTSIDNGFEYHYRAIADAADEYQVARENQKDESDEVEDEAGGLLEQCRNLLKDIAGQRIDAKPPGSYGAIALVVNTRSSSAAQGFESSFVSDTGTMGTRAAVSAATLLADDSQEGKTVLTSLLDGLGNDAGAAVGAAGIALDLWSSLLSAYADGQEALTQGVSDAINALPLASASGLGTWAGERLSDLIESIGLQPAKLDALRAVTVNSAHVASKESDGIAARFLQVKKQVLSFPASTTDPFASLALSIESDALEQILDDEGRITIAEIDLGFAGSDIPLTLTLPESASDALRGVLDDAVDAVLSLHAEASGVRVWT